MTALRDRTPPRPNRPGAPAATHAGERLREYRRKRDFRRSPEPAGRRSPPFGAPRLGVQEHPADVLSWEDLDRSIRIPDFTIRTAPDVASNPWADFFGCRQNLPPEA
jgi:hypothetical protein